jgi:exonuclease SbcD
MTVKFIVTGDLHYRGTNPRARLDNFQEALTKKIYEVYGLAVLHGAKAIIIPGDVFDGPSPGWGTASELGMIMQAAPCPVLVIPGNHDVWGGNPGSKYRTPFGMLARLGLMWDLTDEPFEAEDKEPFDIAITGHGFTVETDTELGKGQFALPAHMEVWDGTAIHVVHSMLMDHSPGFKMRHTLISQVETTAQVIISGHEHIGFGIHRRDDGVLFINPGALCRLSAHHEEIARQVQVALLTVEGSHAEAELIPLKSAAPGHEILSRQHLEAEAERNDRLEKFLSLLASEGESKFLEVREIVEDIAAREALPEEVKAEGLRRIGEARERLGVG